MDSEVFQFWKNVLVCCNTLQDQDAVMFMASEDPRLSNAEYIRLSMFCRERLEAGAVRDEIAERSGCYPLGPCC